MSPKSKKAILLAAIVLCFIVSADRIYKFYLSHIPLAQPGECLEVNDPEMGTVKLKVLKNDRVKAETEASVNIEFLPGLKMEVPIKLSYDELREMNAKKVGCE